jgi:predicted transposase YbfD/YdcC
MVSNRNLLEHFEDLPDPRMTKKCDHLLIDVLMIAICATIAHADSWEEMAQFGRSRYAWLKQWLRLPNGIPSHDTFRRVFELIDPLAFERCFMAWVSDVFQLTDGQVVAIDGKVARGTCNDSGKAHLYLVSAWATANGLSLGQVPVEDKANEIVAIPALLQLLTLKGCIVTLDAIACQKTIVETLCEAEADYVITVKGNQPTLSKYVQQCFAAADAAGWSDQSPAYCETLDDQHGRIDRRQCWVLADSEAAALGWRGCRTLVRIQRTSQRETRASQETHYYITSLPPMASLVLGAVRAHWQIENSCHWVLDVVFREDANRTRSRNADNNLARLRKIALNLLRQSPGKGSLKGKRFRAALDEDFLWSVLQSSSNLMR